MFIQLKESNKFKWIEKEEEFEKEPIKITDEALSKALEIQNKTPCWFGMDLRLYLDGKGCDGFFYGVTFDNKTPEDLIF